MNVSSHSPYGRRSHEVKIDSKEKDMLISQLKAHIFELEQHEKDYDNLNQKFRNLQNECSLLNQEKLRLEYEIKQRTESQNKQNVDLRNDLENLQANFNEKLVINKKLYNENSNLSKNLEIKNLEANELNQRLDDYSEQIRILTDEKLNLERIVGNLNDLKNSQKIEISKLVEDNQKLTRICQDHEKALKNLEAERLKLLSKNDELNFQVKNLNGKLQSREENLSHTNRQWEESKNVNAKLQQTLREYEKKMELQRNEINNLNSQLGKERNQRSEAEKEIENLKVHLIEREKSINRFANELDMSKNLNSRLTEEKRNLNIDNERLDNHIVMLNKQNDDLISELRNVLDEDERIRIQLGRKNKVLELLKNNKSVLEKSLMNLDEFMNRSNRSSMSPSFHLNKSKDY